MPAEAHVAAPSPSAQAALPATRLLGDERLADLVSEGDHDAFSLLYERYERPLYRYCLAILQHPDDARDALQVTMLNAFRSLSKRADGIRVRPWLYRIAHNAAISVARERRSHAELPAELSTQRLPLDDLLERELAEQILVDLSDLPSRRRGALVMRELQGLRYEEIATALDVTPGAARQAVFEARETLASVHTHGDVGCREVCQRISLRDGRRLRSRAVRLHLRACDSCRRFGQLIHSRRRALAALPPLAAGVRWRILDGILQTAGRADAVTAISAGAKGGVLGLPLLLKGLAVGAATLAVGAGTVAVDQMHRDPPQAAVPAIEAPASTPATTTGGAGTARAQVEPKATKAAAPTAPATPAAPADGGETAIGSHAASQPNVRSQPGDAGAGSPHDVDASPVPGSGASEAGPPPHQSGDGSGQQHEGTPPGHGGTPPGQGGTPPGQGGTPPGQGGTPPGQGGTPPGQGGTPPGQGGTPPGQLNGPSQAGGPGPGATSSGAGRTPPSQPEPAPPGGTSAGTPPGQGGTPPGQGGTPPGQGGLPPGQSAGGPSSASPGHGGTPPGQGGTPPGQANH